METVAKESLRPVRPVAAPQPDLPGSEVILAWLLVAVSVLGCSAPKSGRIVVTTCS